MSFVLSKNEQSPTGKIIFVDFSIFMHRAIYSCAYRNELQFSCYLCLSMIFSSLRNVGITTSDIIILAGDTQQNWRKCLDCSYKANRAEKKKKDSRIAWEVQYAKFNNLLEHIQNTLPFNVIKIDTLEADDIIGYGVRYFKEKICIIVSSDSDFDQLQQFENVRIFSPVSKKYKIVKNPELVVPKKIKKEKTDNLISPILNEDDYNRRNTLVNLSKLPNEIEQLVHFALENLNKNFNFEDFKYKNILPDINDLYDTKNCVSLIDSFKKKKKRVEKDSITLLNL